MPFPDFPDPLKPKRTGTQFAFEHVDGAAEESGYSDAPADQQRLVSAILEAMHQKRPIVDFYYKDYATSRSYWVPGVAFSKYEVAFPIFASMDRGDGLEALPFDLRMNRRPGRSLDPTPRHRIVIDLDETSAHYYFEFLFVKGTLVLDGDEVVELKLLDADFDVDEQVGKLIRGVSFATGEVGFFVLMNEKLGTPLRNIEGYIFKKFSAVYADLAQGDHRRVSNFYAQAPISFLATLDIDTLVHDAGSILMYDKETWLLDNSNVMIKVLGVIIGVGGGTAALYDGFDIHPRLVKDVYYNLDKSARSMLYGGEEVPHKTIFATMLALVCSEQGLGGNPQRWKPYIAFKITKDHRVSSNIWSEDDAPDQYNLIQEHRETVVSSPIVQGNPGMPIVSNVWVRDRSSSLHPLDMVTLELEGPDGAMMRMVVPAIFVKDMAYHREWEELMQNIRLGVDILIIIFSVATIVSGASGIVLAASIIDLGLASGDVAIQTFASEIANLPGGKEFLELWDKVFLVGGIMTGAPFLGMLLVKGGKLLLRAMSAAARAELVGMLKLALRSVRGFPQFVRGTYEIVVDFARELGAFARQMQLLAEEGVMLLKGVVEGDTATKYYLLFRNAILESGTLEEMQRAITRIIREGRADLARYLERLFWMRTGTGGWFNYLTEVTSARMVGQEQPMSCAAACIRQIALDNGEAFVEEQLRRWAKTTAEGTFAYNIAGALRLALPGRKILEYSMRIEKGFEIEAVTFVMDRAQGSWITQILNPLTSHSVHTVIVDKIVDGLVHIRDPWDIVHGYGALHGVEVTIEIEKFAYYWEYAGASVVHLAK